MFSWWKIIVVLSWLVLSGCATNTNAVRNQVTTFHEWPANLQEKTYVFEQSQEQVNNLEYRSYQNLVRNELQRLGFTEVQDPSRAKLKVGMNYQVEGRDVRVIEPVVVGSWHEPFYFGSPWYPYRYYPYAHPFWYGPPIVEQRETRYELYKRQLQIGIARLSDGKKLYDVTVNSRGTNSSLAAVMPYMVRSAFLDFPGKSGVTRTVNLKMEDQ